MFPFQIKIPPVFLWTESLSAVSKAFVVFFFFYKWQPHWAGSSSSSETQGEDSSVARASVVANTEIANSVTTYKVLHVELTHVCLCKLHI